MEEKSKQQGLTLIEVLIALAIISIALTAIIKAASQSIRSTAYLQNKTIALWIGQNVMNEARVKELKLDLTNRVEEHLVVFNQDWYWRAELKETPNQHIKKIIVDVYDHQPDEETASLSHLTGYLYEA